MNVRLDEADKAIFDELVRRRREALGATEGEYSQAMFVRAVFRKLAEEAGIVPKGANTRAPKAASTRTPKAKRAKR